MAGYLDEVSKFRTLSKYLFLTAFATVSVLVGINKLPLWLFFVALVPFGLLLRTALGEEKRAELEAPASSKSS
jgi:hypothetical protein